MERKDFLQGLGVIGLGSVLPLKKDAADRLTVERPFACTLTPSETAGPYPYTGTVPSTYTSSVLYRSNIIGDLPTSEGGGTASGGTTSGGGILLTLTLTLQNENCVVIPGARVDIWHCSKLGHYSGYYNSQNGNIDYTNYTFLRGIQTTNSSGQVTFSTIFPSWYIPRAIHFHVQVYINGTLTHTTQFGVADSVGVTVNNSTGYNRSYTYTNSTDQVFSDGFSNQLLTVSGSNTAGYTATGTMITSYVGLPLKLLSFVAGIDRKNINLWWTTTGEENVGRYEIERSDDGRTFSRIGVVGAVNAAGDHTYSFTDRSVSADVAFYRLKMVDVTGSYTYSTVLRTAIRELKAITLYPNPVRNKLLVTHPKTDTDSKLWVLNINGQSVASSNVPASVSATSLDLSFLKAGQYLLVMESAAGRNAVMFTKQ